MTQNSWVSYKYCVAFISPCNLSVHPFFLNWFLHDRCNRLILVSVTLGIHCLLGENTESPTLPVTPLALQSIDPRDSTHFFPFCSQYFYRSVTTLLPLYTPPPLPNSDSCVHYILPNNIYFTQRVTHFAFSQINIVNYLICLVCFSKYL